MKNNPSFLAEADLADGFVVRKRELSNALELIRTSALGGMRHPLLIGQRGMGKTTLSLMAVARVRSDPELARRFFPVVLWEECYEVSTPGELWLAVLRRLASATGEPELLQAQAELGDELDEGALHQGALARLRVFSERRDVRLLVVVENLDMLFGEQIQRSSAEVLARDLERERCLLLLATATTRPEALEPPNGPLRHAFDPISLDPLGPHECRTLWEKLTANGSHGGERLEGDRVRPVQILTSGNPRLVTLLGLAAATGRAGCVKGRTRSLRAAAPPHELGGLMGDFARFVDDHTSYFKASLEVLPPVERKVFVTLADLWMPATARQVGAHARIDVNRVSSLLHRLERRGAVAVVHREGRRKTWQVRERPYNLYQLMRRAGSSSARLEDLIEFMALLYASEPPTEAPGPELRRCRELVAQGDWAAALGRLAKLLAAPPEAASRSQVAHLLELLIDAAAAGHASAASLALRETPWEAALEPMALALRMADGGLERERAAAPQEVLAVALDVLSRISARRPE